MPLPPPEPLNGLAMVFDDQAHDGWTVGTPAYLATILCLALLLKDGASP